ncbi:MAG: hypothetical protein DMG45_03415, partial [Acidobacteria bacterium]
YTGAAASESGTDSGNISLADLRKVTAAVKLTESCRGCYKILFRDGSEKPTVRSYGVGARLPTWWPVGGHT